MKSVIPPIGLACLLAVGGAVYWRNAREEGVLTRNWKTLTSANISKEAAAPPETSATAIHVAEALHPPEIRHWTDAELEAFLTRWTEEVKAEEKRLLAAGQEPWKKFEPYQVALAGMTAGDLLAVCYRSPPGVFLLGGMVNQESSEGEIRNMIFSEAHQATVRRFPFLSLQLPQNQIGHRPYCGVYWALEGCSRADSGAAWEVVKTKFGGKSAPREILSSLLHGVPGDSVERLRQAESWGVLKEAADFWPVELSTTREGQEAWIAAHRDTDPAERDGRIRSFAKEVETSEGFDGLRRLMGQVAEKGTPLYDSLLREAAGRDLEEEGAPKADWIMSEASPDAAEQTAETLIRQWTATDPLAASEWLDKAPKSAPWRKAAVLAFARTIEPHDPEAAASWRKAAE